ncbi:MAG TPA: hypothetical protein VFP26_10790 [Gemmatimonadaceae bacterium]|nr:hypothetical protein [Gemmatimonadaceae bacterium]
MTRLLRFFALVVLSCLAACGGRGDRRDSTMATDSTSTVDALGIQVEPTSPQKGSKDCGDRTIDQTGIGYLKLGMLADSLKAICPIAFDTVRPGPEGESERVISVSFPPESIEAEILQDTVWRLNVRTPGFRTRDSVGIGSPVGDLLRRGDAQGLIGEGNFVVVYRDRCGMSFVLSGGMPPGRPRVWTAKDLATLPSTRRVERIMIYRCAPVAQALTKSSN